MEIWEYCSRICGGKCCYLHLPEEGEPIPCPRLAVDSTCSIYAERYKEGHEAIVVIGYFKSKFLRELDGTPATRPFPCGRIKDIAARGGLPPEVERQCVVLHPELLEELQDQ